MIGRLNPANEFAAIGWNVCEKLGLRLQRTAEGSAVWVGRVLGEGDGWSVADYTLVTVHPSTHRYETLLTKFS